MKVSKCKINFVSTIVKPMVCAMVCALSAYAVHSIFSNILKFGEESSKLNGYNMSTLIAVAVAVVVYAVCLLIVNGIAYDDLVMLPKGKKIAKALAKYGLIG